jgi:hypothetical protein
MAPDVEIEKKSLAECPNVSPRGMGPCVRRDDML